MSFSYQYAVAAAQNNDLSNAASAMPHSNSPFPHLVQTLSGIVHALVFAKTAQRSVLLR